MGKIIDLFKSAEDKAKSALAKLEISSVKESQDELDALKVVRAEHLVALKSLKEALASYQTARAQALVACEAGWNEPDDKWDASLQACAKPVLDKASEAKTLLQSIATKAAAVEAAGSQLKASTKKRQSEAEALLKGLSAESLKKLQAQVAKAVVPLEGARLRIWALAVAEAAESRQVMNSVSSEVGDETALLGEMRERRAAYRLKEKTKADLEAKARQDVLAKAENRKQEAKKIPVEPTPTPKEEGSPVGILLAAAVTVAVVGLLVFVAADPVVSGYLDKVRASKTTAEVASTFTPQEAQEVVLQDSSPPKGALLSLLRES